MFLSYKQILELIGSGSLQIDPLPSQGQLGPFTIDLRLGTEFKLLPTTPILSDVATDWSGDDYRRLIAREPQPISIELGRGLGMPPKSRLLASTLEYIKIPADLAGFILPRTAWLRLGIVTEILTIDPSFQGKLTLFLNNLGNLPVVIYPGTRIVKLALIKIETPPTSYKPATGELSANIGLEKLSLKDEIQTVKDLMVDKAKKLTVDQTAHLIIRDLFKLSSEAKRDEKGKVLEQLVVEIFKSIKGLNILKVNARLQAEEIDLIVQNEIDIGSWRQIGSPILVECKNHLKKIGARDISVLFGNLESMSPDAKTAILFAPNGVTGDSYSDALLKIREFRQKGRNIVVIDRKSLEEIASGIHASIVIEKRFNQLWLI